ncbi:MAG: glycosyltransferase [Hymenobacter sp.]
MAKYGICEAYNKGAARSKYSIVCFMHEDIYFHTLNWGQLVVEILADEKIGVLGVAGGTYVADAPGSWNSCGSEYIVMQIQHTVNGRTQLDRLVPEHGNLFPVAAVDGVWMCCRKAVWQDSPFDATVFPGFHFYDVDFCTRIFPTHQICVTTAVLIEHFSRGSYTELLV